mgnify:CR=1 FL=1
MIFLLCLSTSNPFLLIDERKKAWDEAIRDMKIEIVGEDVKFSYQWMRSEPKYRIVVYRKSEIGWVKDYSLIYDGEKLWLVDMKRARVEEVPFYTFENLCAVDWLHFMPENRKWKKERIIEFKGKGIKGEAYLDADGVIKKVVIESPERVEIDYTSFERVGDYDAFPVEWSVIKDGKVYFFSVTHKRINKGMCSACTFRIPKFGSRR